MVFQGQTINRLRSYHGISWQCYRPRDCCLDVWKQCFFANAIAKAVTPSMRCFRFWPGASNVSSLDLPQQQDTIVLHCLNQINRGQLRSVCSMDTMQHSNNAGVIGCGSNPFLGLVGGPIKIYVGNVSPTEMTFHIMISAMVLLGETKDIQCLPSWVPWKN